MDPTINVTVNGNRRTLTTPADRSLLEVLREEFGLHGTRFGCGEGQCGCCGVLIDGRREFSCLMPISEADGKSITTIEGLAEGPKLHPVQQAFADEGAYQCGYCVSGMIVAAVSLLNQTPQPTDDQIRSGMGGNICRCCGYDRIMNAVRRVSKAGR